MTHSRCPGDDSYSCCMWREGRISGMTWYLEVQFPLDHQHLCRSCLGRKSRIGAKLALPSVLSTAGAGGERGRVVGRGASIMLFLCSHFYLVDEMDPEFANWKSFPHNLKQHLPPPVAGTGRLTSPCPCRRTPAPTGSICRHGCCHLHDWLAMSLALPRGRGSHLLLKQGEGEASSG